MRVTAFATALLALTSFAACKSTPAREGGSCSKKRDCAEGSSCLDGVCTKLAEDAARAKPTVKLATKPTTKLAVYCATAAALAGTWTFDTTVVGAERLAPRGTNGHYEMSVVVVDCIASATLTKSGYDEVVYSKDKIQTSKATLDESAQIVGAAEATFSLAGKPSHTMIFMVRDGQLFGHWQSTGDEWTRGGMWGYLRGVPAGQDLAEVEDFSVQPCEVACLTQCDAARRTADATLDKPALAACMSACGGEQPIVGCGPGEPLPEPLITGISGPAKSLDALCEKAGAELLAQAGLEPGQVDLRCDLKPKVKAKPASRTLGKGALNGSFQAAQLIQVGYFDVGYTGSVRLALATEAGWFWTKPLMDVSMAGIGGVSVTTTSLVLRPAELLSCPGREVVVELAMQTTDSDLGVNEVSIDDQNYLVVCSTGSPPACMRMTSTWASQRTLIDPDLENDPNDHPDLRAEQGELYLGFLPGDLLSISTPASARAADRKLHGIYAWPR